MPVNEELENKMKAATKALNERRLKKIEELRSKLDSGQAKKEVVQRRIQPLAIAFQGKRTPILDELTKRIGPGTYKSASHLERGNEAAKAARMEEEAQKRFNRRRKNNVFR